MVPLCHHRDCRSFSIAVVEAATGDLKCFPLTTQYLPFGLVVDPRCLSHCFWRRPMPGSMEARRRPCCPMIVIGAMSTIGRVLKPPNAGPQNPPRGA